MTRKLSEEERQLLDAAMKGVRVSKKRAAKAARAPAKANSAPPTARPPSAPKPEPAKRQSKGPLPAIDRRAEQNLKRGKTEISATLDLHGMKQVEAHHALVRFIAQSAAHGHKAVLVITGKGSAKNSDDKIMPSERRGVLKTQVPLWLEEPGVRHYVVGLRAAGPRHGGSGALYVLLRKGKP